ncbi:MAG: hypothetical protein KAR21_06635, partial [Spirochaetales bacterium]|nr:hypothetical protein [Spirochaetales bacterium]
MIRKTIFIILISIFVFSNSFAQELGEFEDSFQEAEEEDSITQEQDDQNEEWNEEDEGLTQVLMKFFARLMWYIFLSAGNHSYERMNPPEDLEYQIKPREKGDPLIPIIRSDSTLGMLSLQMYSLDQRIELGYGALALSGRYTLFFETDKPSRLHLLEGYIHYRMSFGDIIEFSPGAGVFGMSANSEYSGFSLSLPLRLHLKDYASLELISGFNFYPSGITGVDTDLSILIDLGN